MLKSLIFCILTSIFFLIPAIGQEENRLQNDSMIPAGNRHNLKGFENQNSSARISGYAGLMVSGNQTGYYGGLNYAIKDNQAIRFEFLYAAGNNFLFQPGINVNSRIVSPSILYQYTIIGKSGYNTAFGYQPGSAGFSLYTFTGIGAQIYSEGNALNINETHLSSPNGRSYSIIVPLGIGMNYKFDNNMTIGLEIRGNFHSGMNSYQNSYGQWGYPGVMFGQYRNGPGF